MTETPPPRRPLAAFLRSPAREGQPPADAGDSAQAPAAKPEQATLPTEVTRVQATPDLAPAPVSEAGDAAPGVTAPTTHTPEPVAPTAVAALADVPPAAAPSSEPAVDWGAARLPVAAAAAPRFAQPRSRARAPRAPAWQWGVLVAFALLLVLQILLADRARLAADAHWRPLLSAVCGALRCELPVWHEPSAFTMLDRDVRPSPGETAVLRVQASFRNDARWPQAWPWLQLSLSDADGRVIGSRVFSPTEYLGHAPDPGQTLAPGQSGRIDFRVREPAAGTAAFTFDFH
ncbi:MAG TPA: DUF3426 domain-containing protein [Stenotrophomonas sp.]|nr:DUF3426 domain-containing protein [Stenotrophomonas sp.]